MRDSALTASCEPITEFYHPSNRLIVVGGTLHAGSVQPSCFRHLRFSFCRKQRTGTIQIGQVENCLKVQSQTVCVCDDLIWWIMVTHLTQLFILRLKYQGMLMSHEWHMCLLLWRPNWWLQSCQNTIIIWLYASPVLNIINVASKKIYIIFNIIVEFGISWGTMFLNIVNGVYF